LVVNDPIADLLTRIRNGGVPKHPAVKMPSSKMKESICRVLKSEKYIRGFNVSEEAPRRTLRVFLDYTREAQPAITGIQRISKPGRRVYSKAANMPRVLDGLGIAIVSTSRGVMTSDEARQRRLGGEVLCHVW
jgi:small subunit ribosomal protein S8